MGIADGFSRGFDRGIAMAEQKKALLQQRENIFLQAGLPALLSSIRGGRATAEDQVSLVSIKEMFPEMNSETLMDLMKVPGGATAAHKLLEAKNKEYADARMEISPEQANGYLTGIVTTYGGSDEAVTDEQAQKVADLFGIPDLDKLVAKGSDYTYRDVAKAHIRGDDKGAFRLLVDPSALPSPLSIPDKGALTEMLGQQYIDFLKGEETKAHQGQGKYAALNKAEVAVEIKRLQALGVTAKTGNLNSAFAEDGGAIRDRFVEAWPKGRDLFDASKVMEDVDKRGRSGAGGEGTSLDNLPWGSSTTTVPGESLVSERPESTIEEKPLNLRSPLPVPKPDTAAPAAKPATPASPAAMSPAAAGGSPQSNEPSGEPILGIYTRKSNFRAKILSGEITKAGLYTVEGVSRRLLQSQIDAATQQRNTP